MAPKRARCSICVALPRKWSCAPLFIFSDFAEHWAVMVTAHHHLCGLSASFCSPADAAIGMALKPLWQGSQAQCSLLKVV